MSSGKKEGDSVPVTEQYQQLKVMLEEAEIDFDEGSNCDMGSFIDINGLVFQFEENGSLMEVVNDRV